MSARRAASRLTDADSVRLIFARHRGGDTLNIEVRTVLPPDPQIIDSRALGMPPMHHLDPRVLLRRLLDELLIAELTLAMMESFASESSARLQIMQGAIHNIRGKLDDLKRQAGQLRQEEITSELLDIVAGGDAVARPRADAL